MKMKNQHNEHESKKLVKLLFLFIISVRINFILKNMLIKEF